MNTPTTKRIKVLWLKMDENYDHNLFLLKYAPKYYTKVDFETPDLKNYKIYSKTRSIKIARSVILKDYSKEQKPLILRTLKNQKKFIQALLGVEPSFSRIFHHLRTCFLDIYRKSSWRMFIRLARVEALELDFSNYEGRFDPGKYLKHRFWQHLSNLTSLKNISIRYFHQINQAYPNFINKFVKVLTLLPPLENLTLSLNNIEENPLEFNLSLFQIYKYVTCLKVYELSYAHIQELLAQLPYFEKLKDVIILKTITEIEQEDKPVSLFYVKNLSQLKNLESLELSLCLNSKSATLSFLENFSVSPSVKSIKLSFHNLNWESLNSRIFEENNVCSKFYSEWDNLKNLQSLSVSFTAQEHSTDGSSHELSFITPVFRKLTNVSMLYYTYFCDDSSSKSKALDFKILWDSVKHLRSTLRMMLVETAVISLKNFSSVEDVLEDSKVAFKGLNLFGVVNGDINVRNLFKIFPKDTTSRSHHKGQLEIGHLFIDSHNSFGQFLQGLSEIPRNLKISINIDIKKLSANNFMEIFTEFAPGIKARSLLKFNVWNLENGIEANKFKKFQKAISKYKISKIMGIIDKSGRMVYEGAAFNSYSNEEDFFGGGGMQAEEMGFVEDSSSMSEENSDLN